jgi:hypothetical protein
MKSGKCPYCDNAIIQQEECYKCGYILCGRVMTFEDVSALIIHSAKSSQQKSLFQSTIFEPSKTNTSYGNFNSYGTTFQNPSAPYPTPPTYNNTSSPFSPPSSSSPSSPPSSSSPSSLPPSSSLLLPTPSYSSSPSITPSKPHMKQKYIAQPNKPSNIIVKHQKIDENIKYRGIYKPKFLVPFGKPTKIEQNVLNKLSDKDHALEYLLYYYFYFILFLDTLTE